MSTGASLRVETAGLLTTLQDRGRFGHRHLGVPWSGVLIPPWQALANALVNNAVEATVVEGFQAGAAFRVEQAPVRIAVMGQVKLQAEDRHSNALPLQPWRSYRLQPGSRFRIARCDASPCWLLALAGFEVPLMLGSSATLSGARLGGLNGQALQVGDTLHAAAAPECAEHQCDPWPWPLPTRKHQPVRIGAVPGPQHSAFSDTELAAFFEREWRIGPGSNRMGARLEGEPLQHIDPAHRDIVSDAILPGSVQVPAAGQPIVMLADAHTAGGYPKIATVASAHLPALSLMRPGETLRFERLDAEQARAQLRSLQKETERRIRAIAPVREIDSATLLANNLIDGITDGENPDEL